MRYLIDTNICIYSMKRKPQSVNAHLSRMPSGAVGMSVVTFLELSYGVWKSQQFDANWENLQRLRSVSESP